MNLLAHMFLAEPDDADSLIGNLAGDFVKGPLHERFTAGLRKGITEHRRIDAFTDSHPIVAQFRHILIPEHGHYSRIIADVFFDHFLACSFDRYAAESLETFLARAFATIDLHIDELPGMLRFVYPRMRDESWLLSYRDPEGIRVTLRNMSRRLSRRPQLDLATHHLIDSRAQLEELFHRFFPEAVEFANGLRLSA